jgi:hypothetical protein
MRMSDNHIIAFSMLAFGILAQYIETWYFGWNCEPQNMLESALDIITETIWIGGILVFAVCK